MSRPKRSRDLPDLLGDDPEDETYGSRPSPRKKQKRATSGRPKPRRRTGYARSGDDMDDDDDEISDEDSEEDISEVSDRESSTVARTQSGRPARSSAVIASAKYKEPDSDEDLEAKDDIENSEDEKPQRKTIRQPKPSLMLCLKYGPGRTAAAMSTAPRSRTASKSVKQSDTSGVRRSSRVSHDDSEPLVSLTGSGRHEKVERQGSAEPRPISASRPTRAAKRPPTTSTVIEASFEDSQERQEPALTQQSMFSENEEAGGDVEQIDEEVLTGEADANLKGGVIAESVHEEADDDEEGGPVSAKRRSQRLNQPPTANTRRTRRNVVDEKDTSDFDPAAEDAEEEEAMSQSESSKSPQKQSQRSEGSSQQGRRSTRLAKKRSSHRGGTSAEESEPELDADELAEEAAELRATRRNTRKRRRTSLDITYEHPRLRERQKAPDYRVFRPELVAVADDEDEGPSQVGGRRTRGGAQYRSLYTTQGPFGAGGGTTSVAMGSGLAAAGGADSDSSDDDLTRQAARQVGGAMGMTPTTAVGHSLFPQTLNSDAILGGGGAAVTAVGKVKDKKLLADADPLGVDQNVNFDSVGGLENHINQLKEMVMLPLLYPEIFQRMHIVPPRGVLFHGPPGTGKTLLARALASSVSSQGKKVTFYMRKGADALSKWVGEAERQLRLLFEEARKNQPSIIFFDEIDGLAPVRSSRQEQIHASIVATLLALMDGMDGRGQVIVIGATNRPDSVDPALRRPGRFDREFYFPLPNEKARRTIIDINTKGWVPPLSPKFKDQLASITQGYGGADLRALCTEAALNAVQGTYPQIYKSNEKLIINPEEIKVLAKDFMLSVKNMIPSSERRAPSGAAPIETSVEPLLRDVLAKISRLLDDIMPEQKQLTALEEAQYDDRDDIRGFDREILQQRFERGRVFRPRLLVYGDQGMGQQYIGGAVLNRFERLHVQSFDLSILYSETGRSPEAAVIQLFNEARRHKPSVIYIPNVDVWYNTVGESVLKLFKGLLRSIPPNEPVLVLGIMEFDPAIAGGNPANELVKDIFGYSVNHQIKLERPDSEQREEYFKRVFELIELPPTEFPEIGDRKKRLLPDLPIAPSIQAPPKPLSKAELKSQKKNDRMTLNLLKIKLQPLMDQLRKAYKRFKNSPIDPNLFSYLFDERDHSMVSTDLPLEQRQQQEQYRPYEMSKDERGVEGIRETATGKFYYNLELQTIERRFVNGYYKRPKDFLADIKRLVKDAHTSGEPERIIKANEMLTNVETDVDYFERTEPVLTAECEKVFQRELEREASVRDKAREAREEGREVVKAISNVPPPDNSHSTTEVSGPIVLGVPVPGRPSVPHFPRSPMSNGYPYTGSDPAHSSDPLRIEYDVDMSNSLDVPLAMPVPAHLEPTASAGHLTQNTSQQPRVQRAAVTPMAHGSQPIDYHNSASTTTSGRDKSSDKSQQQYAGSRSSGHLTNGTQHSGGTQQSGTSGSNNTQSSNGMRSTHPDFSMVQPYSTETPLPDTQEMRYTSGSSQSQPSSQVSHSSQQGNAGSMAPPTLSPQLQGSQAGLPRQHSAPISQVLNDPSPTYGAGGQTRFQSQPPVHLQQHSPPDTQVMQHSQFEPSERQLSIINENDQQLAQPRPQLICDRIYHKEIHAHMVSASSGFSVEQLEQMMSAVMRTVWRGRAEWNRVKVAKEVMETFNHTVLDIEAMQKVAKASQEESSGGSGGRDGAQGEGRDRGSDGTTLLSSSR